ncbi:MAG: response regulator [Bacteroidota bacterium]
MMAKDSILFVEDELLLLKAYELYFEEKYNVIMANDAESAFSKIQDDPSICCLITDLKMPGLSGLELIKKAKLISSDIYCFLVSGYLMDDTIRELIDNDILEQIFTKPVDMETLLSAIENVLAKK